MINYCTVYQKENDCAVAQSGTNIFAYGKTVNEVVKTLEVAGWVFVTKSSDFAGNSVATLKRYEKE